MKNLLWRVLYAIICVFMIFWLAPMVAVALGFPIPAWPLFKAIISCLAVLYIIWGPAPPAPW